MWSVMDADTLSKLEFDAVRQIVADWARSTMAKARARAIEPMKDPEPLRERIGRVSEIAELLRAHMEPPVGGLKDIALSVKRAGLGVQLEIEPLRDIRDVCDLCGRAYEFWLRLTPDSPRIERLLSDVSDLRPLARSIDDAIDDRGRVRDDATPELAGIRAQLAEFEARIQREMHRLLRVQEIRSALRYPQPTMVGDHHVLAVAVNHRQKVPGVVHRTSASGETVYIEPPKVSEISAEMSVLRSAEGREIRRVLRRLTDRVSAARELLRSWEIMIELDMLSAMARYAMDFDMVPPVIADDRQLRLVDARHPLLEKLFREDRDSPEAERAVVPISIHLGGAFDLVVITGPNTGGKTVVLKTVGLIATMALSGLHIPARAGSQIPMLDDILADIGDEQSLQQSLSTFSGHITRIGTILEHCSPRTLVLLDELGAGTDPTEGAALGQSILDELRHRETLALVTTHLGDLKSYALQNARTENAAVEFDSETLKPTYRLLIGQFGESCALKVARRLNVSRKLIAGAYHHLRRRRGRGGPQMKQLQEMREQTEQARQDAIAAHERASQAEQEFRKREQQLQQEANVQREIERFRTTVQPGDSVRVMKFDKNGTVRRVDRRRELAAVLVGAVEWELPLSDLFPILK